jgi:hypothetical protein
MTFAWKLFCVFQVAQPMCEGDQSQPPRKGETTEKKQQQELVSEYEPDGHHISRKDAACSSSQQEVIKSGHLVQHSFDVSVTHENFFNNDGRAEDVLRTQDIPPALSLPVTAADKVCYVCNIVVLTVVQVCVLCGVWV